MLFEPLRRLLFLCACATAVPLGAASAFANDIPLPKAARASQTYLAQTLFDYIELKEPNANGNFKRLQQFLDSNFELSGWFPEFSQIRQNAEIALARTRPSPQEALEHLRRYPPLTGTGLELLGEALIGIGRQNEGATHIRNAWRQHPYLKSRQKDFLERYAHLLTADDHAERLDILLWNENSGSAKAMLSLVSPQERTIAAARIRLMTRSSGVDAAIEAVPEELRDDPALAYERVRWRRRKGREDDAIELLLRTPPAGTHADKWWKERHLLARYALRHRRYLEAYELARDHALTSGGGFADGEFLAGWIALRFLNNPQRAYQHFKTLQEGVTTPISLARATYWRGRAAEEITNVDPQVYWQQAAALPTTYYGQIADDKAAKQLALQGMLTPLRRKVLKRPADSFIRGANAGNADTGGRDFEDIVALAHNIGAIKLGNEMLLHQARQAQRPDEFDALANIAARLKQKHIQLRIAKIAARKHLFLREHLYPTDAFPRAALQQQNRLVEPALLLAIARQESEFDTFAISPSGALGMMQLLPSTARHTATIANIRYNKDALTQDPVYNIQLGENYIFEMIERFDGSYVLAIAAYNAGPARVSRWLGNVLCDPRRPDCDAIDWIELIPIEETRNYVQRVLENLQNYRYILGHAPQANIRTDLARASKNVELDLPASP